MSMVQLEHDRHCRERGRILQVLAEAYADGAITVENLCGALDCMNVSLTPDGTRFHLQYLEDAALVKLTRAREMPGFRRDRGSVGRPDAIVLVKILPKGLHLIDGAVPEDPGIRF